MMLKTIAISLLLLIFFSECKPFSYEDVNGAFIAGEQVKYILNTLRNKTTIGLKAIVEIGIHEGRSFMCMLEEAPPTIPMVALDLFEDLQKLNYDHSGSGNSAIFQRHLDSFFKEYPAGKRQVKIKAADSTTLHAEDVLKLTGGQKVSLFSIDGCHTFRCTLADMNLALSVLDENGVIMIDDFYNRDWPGVALAVGAFLSHHSNLVTGVAYGYNKYFIVQKSYQEFWRSEMLAYCEMKKEKGVPCKIHQTAGLHDQMLIDIWFNRGVQ